MFNLAQSKLLISGGKFTLIASQKEHSPLELIVGALQEHYVSSATHDNNDIIDPPKCHPGTRTSFLNQFSDWVKDTSSPVYMSWLHGPAGAGKSAIARSLAEILQAQGLLAGSFFFSSVDPKRNTEKYLVVTLAQQLALSIPETQPHIADAFIRDPTICFRSLQTQFEKLILNPVVQLTTSSDRHPPFQPALIIIDGLDECKDRKARCLILKIICAVFPRLKGWLKFLIASRPEYDIQTFFETRAKTMRTWIKHIDILLDIRAHQDVYIYLRDHFEQIKREHPLHSTFDPDWPPPASIQRLVEKSSGQFIYACTVIKYIENAYSRPQKCLDDIINLRKSSLNPYAELDALYLNILSSAKVGRELLINILSAALVCDSVPIPPFLYQIPDNIAKVDHFLESLLLLEPGSLPLALLDLKSLLGLRQSFGISYGEHIDGFSYPDKRCQNIKFWHKSFTDFLSDSTRSKEFYINSGLAHVIVAKGCLKLLSDGCKTMEKYWPQKALCVWLKPLYHQVLAWACVHAPYEPYLQAAMMQYNFLDILQIQPFETKWREITEDFPCVADYFRLMCTNLALFQTAQAFRGPDVYDHLLSQFYRGLRSELELWAPPGSKLMTAFKGAIKPHGIDWSKLSALVGCADKSLQFREIITPNLTGIGQWPYFLEWLLDPRKISKGVGKGDVELLSTEAVITRYHAPEFRYMLVLGSSL